MKNGRPAPFRTCVGCRARRGQDEMTRLALVKNDDGGLALKWDARRRLGGRGAWLCRDSRQCLAAALKKKAFGRAFRQAGPLDATELTEKLEAGTHALK